MAMHFNRPDRDLTHDELEALVREAARLRSEEASRLLGVAITWVKDRVCALRSRIAGSHPASGHSLDA